MVRIDVITVISGLDTAAHERRKARLKDFASPGTEIRPVLVDSAPSSVESLAEMELAAPGILLRVVESEQSGADAIVIWGGHDPSLLAARELVSIPVIAPGMASMYLAASLANSFGLLVQLPNVIGLARRQVRDLGLFERCSGVYSIGVPVLELAQDSAYAAMLETATVAIDQGADAICFGCMAMTAHSDRLVQEIRELRPGAPVINPGFAAIRWSEMVVNLNVSHSKRSYPLPPKPVRFAP